jgi:6-pyruvoyltetrahydropterin/6-carboxytetrahydropterin synthase
MATITIAKKFEFDAGHRLSKGYVGKCANLHGHRYVVEVELASEVLNRHDMVVDFNELARFKELLDSTFDHRMILWEDDPIRSGLSRLIPHLDVRGFYFTSQNPTAEHLAQLILDMAVSFHEFGGFVTAVTLWETPKSWARVVVEDPKLVTVVNNVVAARSSVEEFEKLAAISYARLSGGNR